MAVAGPKAQNKITAIENRSIARPQAARGTGAGDAFWVSQEKITGAVACQEAPRFLHSNSKELAWQYRSPAAWPAGRKHDVAGLQIPVDDSYFMKRLPAGPQSQLDLDSLLARAGEPRSIAPRQDSLMNSIHQDRHPFFGNVVDPRQWDAPLSLTGDAPLARSGRREGSPRILDHLERHRRLRRGSSALYTTPIPPRHFGKYSVRTMRSGISGMRLIWYSAPSIPNSHAPCHRGRHCSNMHSASAWLSAAQR